jgi:lipoprotein-anchoring transpeptidase ErfK/SrfK
LDSGYVWVTLTSPQPVEQDEQAWYMINADEYVQAGYLEVYQPSTFQGLASPSSETFAWMIFDVWTAAVPGELPDEATVLLRRYTIVPIYEEQPVEDRIWYRVGEKQWVEQGMVGLVKPKPRPEGIPAGAKWIEIDLYEQTLAAYEGDEIVYATLVSSGLPWWRTEPGLFQIWVKVRQAKMSGRAGYPDYYFLEDVPWTMYFNGSFALHGAYWHDRFGIRHSHGCVNLSLADAKWIFEWATPAGDTGWTLATEENSGTWVWVHDQEW